MAFILLLLRRLGRGPILLRAKKGERKQKWMQTVHSEAVGQYSQILKPCWA